MDLKDLIMIGKLKTVDLAYIRAFEYVSKKCSHQPVTYFENEVAAILGHMRALYHSAIAVLR